VAHTIGAPLSRARSSHRRGQPHQTAGVEVRSRLSASPHAVGPGSAAFSAQRRRVAVSRGGQPQAGRPSTTSSPTTWRTCKSGSRIHDNRQRAFPPAHGSTRGGRFYGRARVGYSKRPATRMGKNTNWHPAQRVTVGYSRIRRIFAVRPSDFPGWRRHLGGCFGQVIT